MNNELKKSLEQLNTEEIEKKVAHSMLTKNAHAIAVLTEWDEFKEYDWQRIYDAMLKPAFIFDGRNLLDAKKMNEIGFVFQAIGS